MRFFSVVALLVLALGAPLAMSTPAPLMTWSDLKAWPLPAPTEVIRLGERPWQVVDLWLPAGEGPHPVVVMVHGGCWQKAIADRTLMNYAAEDLRQRGLAVWNIEYRGVDEPGGGYPGTFQDVAAAADALRTHAAAFHLNTERVVAFGHSAGGHLALWLAARPQLPEDSILRTPNPLPIAAVVNSGGLADLEASVSVTLPSCLAAIMDDLIGAPRDHPFADTSPARLLPMRTQQIAVNTARDAIAPPILGRGYTARAQAAGDNATYLEIPNEGHVELIAPGTAAFTAQAELLQRLVVGAP
jgi:acetyl esterase/lipase